MSTFTVHILAADKVLYEGDCESLIIPTPWGQYGILAHHCKAICAIVAGRLTYRAPGGKNQYAAVSDGLVKIEDNDVLILVDTAERPEDIDLNKARAIADASREAMLQKRSIREYREALAALARAISRLDVHKKYKE
ncbi:MAG: ATP synthase F1 subunit epsilon [Clostridia bacterium]|nr:ATP synthase F1 subunit epsilon [Clostridia bacterium]